MNLYGVIFYNRLVHNMLHAMRNLFVSITMVFAVIVAKYLSLTWLLYI